MCAEEQQKRGFVEYRYADFFGALERNINHFIIMKYPELTHLRVEIAPSDKKYSLTGTSVKPGTSTNDRMIGYEGGHPQIYLNGRALQILPKVTLIWEDAQGLEHREPLNMERWPFFGAEVPYVSWFAGRHSTDQAWSSNPLEIAIVQIDDLIKQKLIEIGLAKNIKEGQIPLVHQWFAEAHLLSTPSTLHRQVETLSQTSSPSEIGLKALQHFISNVDRFRGAFYQAIRQINQSRNTRMTVEYLSQPYVIVAFDEIHPSTVHFGFHRVALRHGSWRTEIDLAAKVDMRRLNASHEILQSLEFRASYYPKFFKFLRGEDCAQAFAP